MIYLLWPTVRPDMFNSCFQCWKDAAQGADSFLTKVIVNTSEQAAAITHTGIDIQVYTGQARGVTGALYELTSKLECVSDSDVLIVASDDFYPPKDWDKIVQEQFIDFDGAVVFWDGIQRVSDMMTLPVMTFNTLKKLNRKIYHPDYKHQFSDVEVFHNLRELGLIKDVRVSREDILFEHRHHHIHKRESDAVDSYITEVWSQDHATIIRRMQMSLEERLK